MASSGRLCIGMPQVLPLPSEYILTTLSQLVYGTFMFNDLVRPPIKALLPQGQETEREELLPEDPIEHM